MVASTPRNGQTEASRPGLDGPLNGDELVSIASTAARVLAEAAPAIDAINVYPVPDGDTGTNMSATLREAVESAALVSPRTPKAVLDGLAKGALYGARGNSGVILSQALSGLAAGAAELDGSLDAAALATGLEAAARAAYRAVSEPVEGTMLTVLREAAAAARETAAQLPGEGHGEPCLPVVRAALEAAEAAEARTIDQLPKLREAGVPDAGGEGICVILRGVLAALTGDPVELPAMPDRPIAELATHGAEEFGYCTEFVLEPHNGTLDVEAVRAWAESGGNRSVVVVGTPEAVHVHVHADDGQAVLDAAARFGVVSRAKVEDMAQQHGRFRASGTGAGALTALLAVSPGEGISAMFESLGAVAVDAGASWRPNAGAIAAAADQLGVADVIVLPNHKDVVPAARQAATLTRCTLHVVPTENLAQGLAAALAFEPSNTARWNLTRMSEALPGVACVEVTRATSDRRAAGISVRAGQAIALVNGTLAVATDSAVSALVEGTRQAGGAEAGVITVFVGEPATAEEAALCEATLSEAFPGVEIEIHRGGQPRYAFIASVER